MPDSDNGEAIPIEPLDSGSAGTQKEPEIASTALVRVQSREAGGLHAISTSGQWRELIESDASPAVKHGVFQSLLVAQLEKSEADLRVRLKSAEDQTAELRTSLQTSERKAGDLRTDLGVVKERTRALRAQLGSRVFMSAISTLIIGFAGNFFNEKSLRLFWVFLLIGTAIFAASWIPTLWGGGDR